mgnify:CR=1 FL=1
MPQSIFLKILFFLLNFLSYHPSFFRITPLVYLLFIFIQIHLNFLFFKKKHSNGNLEFIDLFFCRQIQISRILAHSREAHSYIN